MEMTWSMDAIICLGLKVIHCKQQGVPLKLCLASLPLLTVLLEFGPIETRIV